MVRAWLAALLAGKGGGAEPVQALRSHERGPSTLAPAETLTDLADVLVEIANVGAGNAAGALSFLANRPFVIGLPAVAVLQADSLLTGPDVWAEESIVVVQRLVGDLDGQVLLALSPDQARALLALLSPGSRAEDLHQAFGQALLRQVAALLGAAYLAALRMFLGMRVTADLPAGVQVAGVPAALAAAATELCEPAVILLRTTIHTPEDDEDAVAFVFFVLPQSSTALLQQRARALLA